MARLERLVFRTGAGPGHEALEEARRLVAEDLGSTPAIGPSELIERITALAFTWSVSDGN